MPREDGTARELLYGGHPPACTCVDCTNRRLQRLGYFGRKEYPKWLWAVALLLTPVGGVIAGLVTGAKYRRWSVGILMIASSLAVWAVVWWLLAR